MNVHKNARLTPRGREILISRLERGEHPVDVATAMGVSVKPLTSGGGAIAQRVLPDWRTGHPGRTSVPTKHRTIWRRK